MLRHADDVTLNHLIDLRKLEVENELLRIENERLREALHKIGYGPPHEGEPLELLNEFVDMARAALKDGE